MATVDETVSRFEGTVDKFTGDGALVLFGAPRAVEDHSRRACLAALELRGALERLGDVASSRHGAAFRVRMGISSGEVVLGRLGSDSREEAIGHTVGLSARLQTLAPPGGICVTGRTAELVDGEFELEDLGSVPVKGIQSLLSV